MIGRRKTAEREPQLVPLSAVAAELIDRGLWQRYDPPSRGREAFLVPDATWIERVRLQAEVHGVEVVAGWQGRPSVSTIGANLIISEVALAAEHLAELERRDDERTAELEEQDRSAVSFEEMLNFMSPAAAMKVMRLGGAAAAVPLPGVVDESMAQAAQMQRLKDSGLTPTGDYQRDGILRTVAPPSDE